MFFTYYSDGKAITHYGITTAYSASFDCSKAKTNVEQTICGNASLSCFDNMLEEVYGYCIKNSKNISKIKEDQLKWLKERNRTFDRGGEIHKLYDQYAYRILELLQTTKAYTFFLRNFVQGLPNINKSLVVMATIALLRDAPQDATQEPLDFCTFFEEAIMDPIIIPLGKQKKTILGFETNRGAYNSTYNFFILSEKAENIEVKPYILPKPKIVPLEESNILGPGNFSLEKKGENYYLFYTQSISSFEAGNDIVWEINENNARVIKEKYRYDLKKGPIQP